MSNVGGVKPKPKKRRKKTWIQRWYAVIFLLLVFSGLTSYAFVGMTTSTSNTNGVNATLINYYIIPLLNQQQQAQTEIEVWSNQINSWQAQVNNWISLVNLNVSQLQTQVGQILTWQTQINIWASQVDTNLSDYQAFKLSVLSFEATVNSYMALTSLQIGILQTQVGVLQTDVSILQTQMAQAQIDISAIQSQIAIILVDIDTLQSQMSIVQINIAVLQSQMVTVQLDIVALQTTCVSLQSQINTIVGVTIPYLQSQIDTLNNSVTIIINWMNSVAPIVCPYDYIIYKNDPTYIAKYGQNNTKAYEENNFANLINLINGSILLKAGTYIATNTISLTSNTILKGESMYNTKIESSGSFSPLLSASSASNITIEDLAINGSSLPSSSSAVQIDTVTNFHLVRLYIQAVNYGIYVLDNSANGIIEQCIINPASTTDMHCIVYNTATQLQIKNNLLTSGYSIGTGQWSTCIYAFGTNLYNLISENILFGQNANSSVYGNGIFFYNTNNKTIITHNMISNCRSGCLWFWIGTACHNIIQNNILENTSYGIRWAGIGGVAMMYNLVEGNTFHICTSKWISGEGSGVENYNIHVYNTVKACGAGSLTGANDMPTSANLGTYNIIVA
nr:hypothetical protein [Candidatus Freyarchaeota archaeon]